MSEFIWKLLNQVPGVKLPQKKFLVTLWLTLLLLRGKANFRNLSRYSPLNEKTYSRQFRKEFDFAAFNAGLIAEVSPISHERIAAMDCSYLPKSGDQTYGLGWFYDSSHDQATPGLEVSNLAVVDVTLNTAYTVSCRQTPDQTDLESTLQSFQTVRVDQPAELTRLDFYAAHLMEDVGYLPADVRYLAADGNYAKVKFVAAVRQVNKHLISRFRHDANLRHLYTGPQKTRGARRKYASKVRFDDVSRFEYVGEVEPGVHLYTALVNSVQLKCTVRLVYVLNTHRKHQRGYALLFCTDTSLDAYTIFRYYKARFQIEFVFRDAKQFTGLADCQARCKESLHFHFNASFAALNLAKADALQRFDLAAGAPFSLSTQKSVYFNQHLLDNFIRNFDLDPTLIKNTPQYAELVRYGAIAG